MSTQSPALKVKPRNVMTNITVEKATPPMLKTVLYNYN